MPSVSLPARSGAVTRFYGYLSTTSLEYAARRLVYMADDRFPDFWFMDDLSVLPWMGEFFDLSLLPCCSVLSARSTCHVFLNARTYAASIILILDNDRHELAP